MVIQLDGDGVRAARCELLIAEMESALIAFSSGHVIQPVRSMITIEEEKRYLGIMPAVAQDAMGLKLVSFYLANAGTAVPTHLAMILLFRPETGDPLAIMDGWLITEMRTGGSLCSDHPETCLAPKPCARPARQWGAGQGTPRSPVVRTPV